MFIPTILYLLTVSIFIILGFSGICTLIMLIMVYDKSLRTYFRNPGEAILNKEKVAKEAYKDLRENNFFMVVAQPFFIVSKVKRWLQKRIRRGK